MASDTRTRTEQLTIEECERIPGFAVLRRSDPASGNWKARGVPWEKIGPLLYSLWLTSADGKPHPVALAEALALVVRYYHRVGEQVLKFDGWVSLMRYADENAQTRAPAQETIAGAAPATTTAPTPRPKHQRRTRKTARALQ